MKEAELSAEVIRQLKYAGRFAYKTSDRFQTGVPDIYMAGGTWCESKVHKCSRSFWPMKLLRPEQKIWADKLTNGGDAVYILVYVEFPNIIKEHNRSRKRYYFTRWQDIKDVVVLEDCVDDLAKIIPCLVNRSTLS